VSGSVPDPYREGVRSRHDTPNVVRLYELTPPAKVTTRSVTRIGPVPRSMNNGHRGGRESNPAS